MVKEKFINDFERSYEYEKEVQTEITELPPYYIAAMPDAVQEEIKAKVVINICPKSAKTTVAKNIKTGVITSVPARIHTGAVKP